MYHAPVGRIKAGMQTRARGVYHQRSPSFSDVHSRYVRTDRTSNDSEHGARAGVVAEQSEHHLVMQVYICICPCECKHQRREATLRVDVGVLFPRVARP